MNMYIRIRTLLNLLCTAQKKLIYSEKHEICVPLSMTLSESRLFKDYDKTNNINSHFILDRWLLIKISK